MTLDEARQRAVEAAAREWLGATFDDASEECRVDWLREMTAAIQVWEAALWQPIETAPRDGTKLILHWDWEPMTIIGEWCDTNVDWVVTWDRTPLRGGFDAPTHWRPLPAGPGGTI